MTASQLILMQLVRSCITGSELSEDVKASLDADMIRQLYILSSAHDIAHLVAHALDQCGLLKEQNAANEELLRSLCIAVVRHENLDYELDRLCAFLEQEQIPFIPLKGSVLKSLYPKPWMRVGCDLDILVKPEDIETVTSLLERKLNYHVEKSHGHEISFYTTGNIHIELHHLLTCYREDVDRVLHETWNRAVPVEGWKYRYAMDDEMFYFYHVAHMAKHFVYAGCGIRPFIDLWLLNHKKEYDRILFEESGLAAFEKSVSALAEELMSGAELSDLSNRMVGYIFDSGIYGTKQNDTVMQIVRRGKKGYIYSPIFLPYSALSTYYPKLKGRKYLLPFYQVVRWCRVLFVEKFGTVKKRKADTSTLKEDSIVEIKELAADLGLIDLSGTH